MNANNKFFALVGKQNNTRNFSKLTYVPSAMLSCDSAKKKQNGPSRYLMISGQTNKISL